MQPSPRALDGRAFWHDVAATPRMMDLSPLSRPQMYGLIGKMLAAPGRRDDLIAILLEGVAGMPGCLSYVVARDMTDPDALWISEVWQSRQAHEASLALPSVREAIARGRPLIAGFGERFETEPVGGHGLAPETTAPPPGSPGGGA